ncbi:sgt1 [Hyphodiscus hymeniophilus]|uniref:Sgt1 n=1 Tax=Hyphodiscus hymeniophilus TaxID=353542 RepID=A0A9P7AUM3_9HELO|nr:sgt1 [Hyphodiscus hymeniophilus]
MSTQAALGKTALDSSNYSAARLGQHSLALADADNAVLAARARARRELIAQAQFRRAVALHGLKRFGDARLCLTWTRKMDEKMKALGMWQAKVVKDWDDAGGEGAEENVVSVKEFPDKSEEVNTSKADAKEAKTVEERRFTKEEKGKMPERSAAAPILTATPKEKIRHEFYQSTDKLTITVFAKGVPKDKGEVIIKEGSLDISFPIIESTSTYDLSFDPLFARIDPDKSSYRITPHKIEILLHKSVAGLKWPSLEGTEPIASSSETTTATPSIPSHIISAEKAPVYPTSSRHGPKNWDALASSALRTKKDDGEDDGKEEEDDDGGDPANAFFKQLYKGADPDTRRAMMKSYQESNGTALSTNWEEVKKDTVKTQPPDGVEAKKWGA